MVVHHFQPGMGDICADATGLLVKEKDIDIYNYVHFSVIEGGHRVKTKQGCQEVDLRRYPVDSIWVHAIKRGLSTLDCSARIHRWL